jgi:Flp pilus assembly protein TadG
VTTLRRRASRVPGAGQSTVELALLLPVVVVLLLLVLQVGLLARDVLLVTHASREAARAAAVEPTATAAREAAEASSGLEAARLRVELSGGRARGDRVRVAVTYRAQTAVPVVGALLGDRTIRAAATMRVESGAPGAP